MAVAIRMRSSRGDESRPANPEEERVNPEDKQHASKRTLCVKLIRAAKVAGGEPGSIR